ncbi:hypothetical protein IC582_017618 [Cucumis melo]
MIFPFPSAAMFFQTKFWPKKIWQIIPKKRTVSDLIFFRVSFGSGPAIPVSWFIEGN